MSTDDRFTQWDAAYVLGALSSADRLEYEEHLGRCRQCRDAVAELAGLPGLLSRLPAEEADLLLQAEQAPSVVEARASVPGAAGAGPREREVGSPALPGPPRRLLLAAAAAVVVGGLGGYAIGQAQGEPGATPPAAASPARIAFSPVTPSAMTAVLDVAPIDTGTRLRVECQYASAPGAAGWAYADYALVVVGRDGDTELARTWTARPNVVMRPTADTQLALSDIAAVEIRAVEGDATLMRAELG